jgi:hypothetical protein
MVFGLCLGKLRNLLLVLLFHRGSSPARRALEASPPKVLVELRGRRCGVGCRKS